VPQVMGPTEEPPEGSPTTSAGASPTEIAARVLASVMDSSYLPPIVQVGKQRISLELALLLLACHATGSKLPPDSQRQLTIDAMPGVADAITSLKRAKKWSIHGPRYHQAEILKHFRLQCWTLKPAFRPHEYVPPIEIGRYLNPMFERRT